MQYSPCRTHGVFVIGAEQDPTLSVNELQYYSTCVCVCVGKTKSIFTELASQKTKQKYLTQVMIWIRPMIMHETYEK
jgi:hypothetical protein